MKEQLISFETAKLAKEKGFEDHLIGAAYSLNGYIWTREDGYSSYEKIKHKNPKKCFNRDVVVKEEALPAPTQSLLQKWLRETQDIFVTIRLYRKVVRKDFKYGYCIQNNKDGEYYKVDGRYIKTYEEALEKGLKEALKLIKDV